MFYTENLLYEIFGNERQCATENCGIVGDKCFQSDSGALNLTVTGKDMKVLFCEVTKYGELMGRWSVSCRPNKDQPSKLTAVW